MQIHTYLYAIIKYYDELVAYMETTVPVLAGFILKALLSILVYVVGTKIIDAVTERSTHRMINRGSDPSMTFYLRSFLRIACKLLLAIALLGQLGVKDATIVAALGSVGVGIGLALQGGAANFAGGVLIMFLKPFRVGDFIIEVNENNQGTVKAIGMFYTTLVAKGDRKIIIPNSKLTDASVINLTASGFFLCDITVGISYDDDIDKARRIMLAEAEKDPRVLKDKEMKVLLAELADSSVNLELRCWTSIDDHWETLWDLTENIKKAFDANNITIAFNQVDVHLDSKA